MIRMLAALVIALFTSLLSSASTAHASQAWGVTVGNSTSIDLRRIEIATGDVSTLSRSGDSLLFANVDDLASDPVRHPRLVWAVRTSGNGNELIAVDPYLEQIVSLATIDAAETILAIAIDPLTGAMYGTSTNALYTIDAFNGESTLVGATADPVTSGLGFDLSGRLFGVGAPQAGPSAEFVEIDTADASLNMIGTLVTNGVLDIAADPTDGVMYGLGPNVYQLVSIDLASSDVTPVGDSLSRPGGLAFTGVPEPASATICISALFSLLLASSRSRWE